MPKSIFDQVENILLAPTRVAAKKPLKILIVGPEVSPYANVGGVARVLGFLSRALIKLGHDVRLLMPKFGFIDEEKYPMELVVEKLKVPTGQKEPNFLVCNVKTHTTPGGAPVYFLENMEYYEKRANVYGYSDDPIRWALLSRGALEFLRSFDLPAGRQSWHPDVIHANDWQSGYIPNWLRTNFSKDEKLLSVATLFTIHNLHFQGIFDHRNISELDFDDGKSPIEPFFSERLLKQNFMRRGIMYADVVNTVSKTYAKEILTPAFGEHLDRLLTEVRSKLFGVLNGIDYEEFNPATDKLIPVNYDLYSLEKRAKNKLALQEEFDLTQDEKIPVIGFEGRLEEQKGLDLIAEIAWPLLRDFDVQFVIVGGGDNKYLEIFRKLQRDFPDKVGAHLMPDFTLPRLIFSGSDIMLFPSRFEPCGIVQMEAQRYGAIPVARKVGGLADTVEDFNPEENTGTGFVFKDFDRWAFFAQVVRALEVYHHKEIWRELQKRAMQKAFSWEGRAKDYVTLYKKAIHLHTEKLIEEGRIERAEEE